MSYASGMAIGLTIGQQLLKFLLRAIRGKIIIPPVLILNSWARR